MRQTPICHEQWRVGEGSIPHKKPHDCGHELGHDVSEVMGDYGLSGHLCRRGGCCTVWGGRVDLEVSAKDWFDLTEEQKRERVGMTGTGHADEVDVAEVEAADFREMRDRRALLTLTVADIERIICLPDGMAVVGMHTSCFEGRLLVTVVGPGLDRVEPGAEPPSLSPEPIAHRSVDQDGVHWFRVEWPAIDEKGDGDD